MTSYPSETAAIEALKAEGYKPSATKGYWTKMSKVDDWHGGYDSPALVEIQHNRVDPQWNAPDYWTWRFL